MKSLAIAAMLLIAVAPVRAQLFKNLLNRAKQTLATSAAKHAERLLDEGLSKVDNEASKVSIVSSKSRPAAPVQATSTVAASGPSTAPKTVPAKAIFVPDTSALISQSETDRYLSAAYPKFYAAYRDATDNDPLVREVAFGYAKTKGAICRVSRSSGLIFFDLSFFEDSATREKEGRYTYSLYLMEGLMHAFSQTAKGQRSDAWKQAMTFAIQKGKLSAEKGYCMPLMMALNAAQKQAASDGKDRARTEAARKVLSGEAYRSAGDWLKANRGSCGKAQ